MPMRPKSREWTKRAGRFRRLQRPTWCRLQRILNLYCPVMKTTPESYNPPGVPLRPNGRY